jgi:hypothetical protein
MYIVSSEDGGKTWSKEAEISLNMDVREPHFLRMPDGKFIFSFFEAGTNPLAFEPGTPMRMFYNGRGNWTKQEPWGKAEEVIWQLGVNNGTAYVSSYQGTHYEILGKPDVKLFFNQSTDGINWEAVN